MLSKTHTIEQFIIQNIENKMYKPNSKIPSQNELCKMFSVSRMTVNKAIQNLVAKQYLITKQGFGTIVNSGMPKELGRLTSFTEDLKNMGLKPRTVLLDFNSTSIGNEFAKEKLGVDNSTVLYIIKRLRLNDEDPIALNVAYINSKIVPTIDISYLELSLYDYLEKQLCIPIIYAKDEIAALKADKETAQLLNLIKNDPVLRICHTTYTTDNVPFEYVETFYNSEKYSFSTNSYR